VGSEDVVGPVVDVDVVVLSKSKRISGSGRIKTRFHACSIFLFAVDSLSYVLRRFGSWLLCNVVFQLQDLVFLFPFWRTTCVCRQSLVIVDSIRAW